MSDQRICPDAGKCHHECTVGCWRVRHVGPLSGHYPHNEWPASVLSLEPQEPDYEAARDSFWMETNWDDQPKGYDGATDWPDVVKRMVDAAIAGRILVDPGDTECGFLSPSA